MIVLLHAYRLGFSAWQTAVMFTLYEVAGVVTNLLAGLMGAKWGIKTTLLTGLTLQLAGIGMLFGWRSEWSTPEYQGTAIIFVTVAQMLCGVAKDLTKLGGKTVTKLVTPDEQQVGGPTAAHLEVQSRLFKIVSFITGFKNSMKGVGYFIGAAALTYSYYFALGILLALIVAAMPWAAVGLSNQLGRARKENITLRTLLLQRHNVNVLSAARFFLFGCRDMWFEVPLPFFLRDARYGFGWERVVVGAVLAAFIIGYGQVQSWTPQAVLQPLRQSPANKYVALLWNAALVLCPAYLAAVLLGSNIYSGRDMPAMIGTFIPGLAAFCVVFAVNSSVHSYLIVRYAEGDKVAMNVGFYYMANAMGRLTGTLASGALYTFTGATLVQGFGHCFLASTAFAAVSTLITTLIRDDKGGLACGACLQLVAPPRDTAEAASVAKIARPDSGISKGPVHSRSKAAATVAFGLKLLAEPASI
ncbi:major facilitator transporter [Monoraphidium neglectum]|uniref:Major facilitator transporter n=1 Tax=Monoraphidium neglectum TaxID=145388 RepID=A0A0D2JYG6_9CHLO|nr:major facilitator transporter [Monoraphidium neglectum]KIZ03603.1 major facilitator transporter [Monoraphidium neglectum]|eukprot:XP_013902622.1 major facilitator transporter [Monoraphidium neglectum]